MSHVITASSVEFGAPSAFSRVASPSMAAHRSTSRSTAPLRLTARGRRVRAGMLLTLAVAATSWGLSFGAQAFAGDETPQVTSVEVRSGESLWSIAERVAPNADPRDAVAAIKSANRLSGSVVQPGTRLIIPSQLG